MHRWLSVPEIFMLSSNIGAARMAMEMGTDSQKSFLAKVGMLRPVSVELPELGRPLYPSEWRPINTMTIAFGHGIAVSPLHVVSGVAAMVNGGIMRPATLIKRAPDEVSDGQRVISPNTSNLMRELFRLVVQAGTGKSAEAPGYLVGGKTGTAEKVINGHYARKRVLNAFTAILPADNPRYQLLIMLDEPQPLKETFGFITSGWNAVPTGGNVIARIAPLLGVEPRFDLPPSDRLILAASRGTQ
jgi:cell division protein FtsI (penicillin-binding protein 3)